ncbi:MAG: hypothetical protein HC881_08615 [Leptolyngbyaceae cyanobacterium SL_7_1]|nr:hypothetical protein [Leptolyngbyaceae cyanobacterium SL_7_1]
MQLGLPQGAAEPMAIAQAMTQLRLKADNQQILTQQAAQFLPNPRLISVTGSGVLATPSPRC